MKKFTIALSILAGRAGPLAGALPADFATTRPILGTDLDAPALVEIRLDANLFSATRPGYPDLRLFNASNQEIPCLIEPASTPQERIVRQPVPCRVLSLQELAGNRIEGRFNLEPNALSPDGLDIRTPLSDFFRTVRVSGSEDGKFWKPLAEGDIFDYSRFIGIRHTEIFLPKNECRYFSFEISVATAEHACPFTGLFQANGMDSNQILALLQVPFRVADVSCWHETTTRTDVPVIQELSNTGLKVTHNRETKTSALLLDTRNTPVTRLDFNTPARNFQRLASIQIPILLTNGLPSWRTVAYGWIFSLQLPEIATNLLSVSFPEQRADPLRVIIQNTLFPPLDFSAVHVFGPEIRLLWLAKPATTYRLAYGNDTLPAPAYDLLAIRTALSNGMASSLWTLGKPHTRPSHHAFDWVKFISHPAVYSAIFFLVAGTLVGLLVKTIRKYA